MKLELIPIDKVRAPGLDVRAEHNIESIRELADSIKELGLLQPITVRVAGDHFEVVTGNRRRMACRSIGLAEVQCVVLEPGDTDDVIGARLHENIFRKDMTPVEEAAVYAELFERVGDIDKVASMCHRSRAVVDSRLALLAGDADVRDTLHAGKISTGVAVELNKVRDAATRSYLLRCAVENGATVPCVIGWRKQYADMPLGEVMNAGGVAAVPETPPAYQQGNRCLFCGGDEDQHDLRFFTIHQYCLRLWNKAQQRNDGGANGQQTS